MVAKKQSAQSKPLVRIVSWNADTLKKIGAALRAAGFATDTSPFTASGMIGKLAQMNPVALVLDSTTRYSDTRIIASVLRQSRAARHVPIIFAGGEGEKIAATRARLPDAEYCSWNQLANTLKRLSQTRKPHRIIVPEQAFSGASLGKKLGIGENMRVAIIHAPDGFEEWLGDLPESARLSHQQNFAMHAETRLAILFLHSLAEAEVAASRLAANLPVGAQCWAVNPKKTTRSKTDFNQNDVRAIFRAAGLMDYKVCSVSPEWSGLKFSRKAKAKR